MYRFSKKHASIVANFSFAAPMIKMCLCTQKALPRGTSIVSQLDTAPSFAWQVHPLEQATPETTNQCASFKHGMRGRKEQRPEKHQKENQKFQRTIFIQATFSHGQKDMFLSSTTGHRHLPGSTLNAAKFVAADPLMGHSLYIHMQQFGPGQLYILNFHSHQQKHQNRNNLNFKKRISSGRTTAASWSRTRSRLRAILKLKTAVYCFFCYPKIIFHNFCVTFCTFFVTNVILS